MSIHINNGYPLLLFIPVIGMLWLTYRYFLGKQYLKSIIFRGITLTLLILGLCGIYLVDEAKETTTVFLADLSQSTLDDQHSMERFIEEAISVKSQNDLISIVVFGDDPVIELSPTRNPLFTGFESSVDGQFTNIQNALISANAIIPGNSKRRIVLLTDGYENDGDASKQMLAITGGNTDIDIVDMSNQDFSEVQFDEIIVPDKVEKDQIIDVQAKLHSSIETKGTLYIYSNNQVKYEAEIDIKKGENRYVFTDQITDSGLVTYTGQIIVDSDTFSENNKVSTFTFVNDLPKLLVVQGEDEQALNLIGMLENSAYLDVKHPLEVPETLEKLIQYDGFILSNVPAKNLSEAFLSQLEKAVRLQGKGLLVTGGDKSYGPGGYYMTTLEEILPVSMNAKPKEEKPNLALMLIIDRSGSMSSGEYGITKIELAKEAAIRSTEILDDKDRIGVIGFDDQSRWVVETRLARDKEEIAKQIASLAPGGGTSILPALGMGVDELKNTDAELKHIILLTDGQAESQGYREIIDELTENDITLSAVAVGSEADKKLLGELAKYGNGRYYETDVFSDIPSIFTKETFMAGKKYLNNITFYPSVTAESPILSGIKGFPELNGYVATTIKDRGKSILSGPDDDPILASWQYGLGRSIAFTSDMKGIWSVPWLSWEQNQNFWINTVSWMVQRNLNMDYTVEGSYLGGEGLIHVKSLNKGEDYASIQGILQSPDGVSRVIDLESTAPGQYEGHFTPQGQGIYLVSLSLGEKEEEEQMVTAVNIGYSEEFNFFNNHGISIQDMLSFTGGRLLTDGKDVFKTQPPKVSGSKDLTLFFLTLFLIAFVLEIAYRKFKPSTSRITKEMRLVRESISSKRSKKKQEKAQSNKEAADHVHELLKDIRKKR